MPRRQRVRRLVVLSSLLVFCTAAGCGGGDSGPVGGVAKEDPGPIHVHGLGVNPADGALFVATHTGLFRASAQASSAERVAGRYQDTMGFAVVGPNRFLGSGHPDGRESLPPFLGLIESSDAGKTWRPVSLGGEVDFHVLEASDERIYGYGSDFESREPRFLTSADGGRHWERLEAPEPVMSLAISPEDSKQIVVSGEERVYRSGDGGRRWRPTGAPAPGLLTWNARGLFVFDAGGRVWRAEAADGSWAPTGEPVGGTPAAADSGPENELLVALHDGIVKRSLDAGRSWTVRSRPGR